VRNQRGRRGGSAALLPCPRVRRLRSPVLCAFGSVIRTGEARFSAPGPWVPGARAIVISAAATARSEKCRKGRGIASLMI